MVKNSTNINKKKYHLSPQTFEYLKYHDVVNLAPGLGHKNEYFLTTYRYLSNNTWWKNSETHLSSK